MEPTTYQNFIDRLDFGMGTWFGPEIVLIAAICMIILVDLLVERERSWMVTGAVAMAATITAFAILTFAPTCMLWVYASLSYSLAGCPTIARAAPFRKPCAAFATMSPRESRMIEPRSAVRSRRL